MTVGLGTSINDVLPAYGPVRGKAGDPPEIGQIVRTVVPNLCDPHSIFDALRADQTRHNAVSGLIRRVDGTDFRPKPNRLPIFALRLQESEELLAVRSKLRPCVVLMVAAGIPDKDLPEGYERDKGRPAFRVPAYLVAPAFSITRPNDPKAFGPCMTARVQCLVYPQFAFLPTSGGIIRNDSIVRLDRAFWTTLHEPVVIERLFLSNERLQILLEQLFHLAGKTPAGDYLELIELFASALPQEYRIAG